MSDIVYWYVMRLKRASAMHGPLVLVVSGNPRDHRCVERQGSDRLSGGSILTSSHLFTY